MKNVRITVKLLFLLITLMNAPISTKACNYADLTLDQVIDNTDGTFDIYLTFCAGGGQDATHSGADQNTGNFGLVLFGGASFANFPATLTSPQTNATYQSFLWQADSLYYFSDTDWWACLGGCGPVGPVCKSIVITTNGLPSAIFMLGMEGGGNPAASCQDQDMWVYPGTTPPDPCADFSLQANAGPDATVYIGYAPAACTDLTVSTSGIGEAPFTYAWSTGATTSSITVCPQTATTYTITITDADGCTTADAVFVDVEDVRCGRRNNKVLVCNTNGATKCLSQNKVAAVLNSGGSLGICSSSTARTTSNTPNNIRTFPSIFEAGLTVEYIAPSASEADIILFDINGRKAAQVHNGPIHQGFNSWYVETDQLGSGTYFIRIQSSDGTLSVQKLIKF